MCRPRCRRLSRPGRWSRSASRAHADAEPLLLENYTGLRRAASRAKVPSQEQQALIRDSVARLVQLYEGWGKPDEAAKWRNESQALRASGEGENAEAQ